MKKYQKILLGLVIGLLLIGAGGWLGWQKLHYPASEAAQAALSKGKRNEMRFISLETLKNHSLFFIREH